MNKLEIKVKGSNFLYDENNNLVIKYNEFLNNNILIEWKNVVDAKSYSIVILNYSASKLVGHPIVCLSVSNIVKNNLALYELENNKNLSIGTNSSCPANDKGVIIECIPKDLKSESVEKSCSFFKNIKINDKHFCKLILYALNKNLPNLKNGYFLSDLNKEIINNVLEVSELSFYLEGDENEI